MTRPDRTPSECWDALPADLRPGLPAIVAAFEARIVAQDARIAELEATIESRRQGRDLPDVLLN
ncbi:hypothetical protein [Paludisphaera soli]|uniref:hypothetical protein n=1 Tax=Paludisphaera soli TaxID=2712865 RepID=UPI0013EB1859|nr:hypothetical protein [Paludisphaera soli]